MAATSKHSNFEHFVPTKHFPEFKAMWEEQAGLEGTASCAYSLLLAFSAAMSFYHIHRKGAFFEIPKKERHGKNDRHGNEYTDLMRCIAVLPWSRHDRRWRTRTPRVPVPDTFCDFCLLACLLGFAYSVRLASEGLASTAFCNIIMG
jgi:hypothetical protein